MDKLPGWLDMYLSFNLYMSPDTLDIINNKLKESATDELYNYINIKYLDILCDELYRRKEFDVSKFKDIDLARKCCYCFICKISVKNSEWIWDKIKEYIKRDYDLDHMIKISAWMCFPSLTGYSSMLNINQRKIIADFMIDEGSNPSEIAELVYRNGKDVDVTFYVIDKHKLDLSKLNLIGIYKILDSQV